MEKSHRSDARIIALSRYRVDAPETVAKAMTHTLNGIMLTAHLRASAGHARHQGTSYRVRSVSDDGRVLLSVRTPDGVKTKKSTTTQVQITRHGAVLRTQVNRAVLTGVSKKPVVVPAGEPVPVGGTAWVKGMAVRARLRQRTVLGVITSLKSRGTVVIWAGERTVEVSTRRLKPVSYARPVLLTPIRVPGA